MKKLPIDQSNVHLEHIWTKRAMNQKKIAKNVQLEAFVVLALFFIPLVRLDFILLLVGVSGYPQGWLGVPDDARR